MECSVDSRPARKSKFTIGYLDDNDYNEFYSQIMMGVVNAAQKYDVNIIRFGYFTSNDSYRYANQADRVLSLIEQYDVDGLLFLGWTEAAAMYNHDFARRFGSIPLLSIGTGFPNIPFVYAPGDIYVREILLHLIEVHNFKKIAYIAPERPDSRNDIFIETVKEHGIYDPALYVDEKELDIPNLENRVKRAVAILLDERKVSFDAIMALSSIEGEALLNEFKARGIHVPNDIAVTSYGDGDLGKFAIPALTTIYYPWVELGYYGCEKMVELLTHGHIPWSNMVPGKIIYRDSCGCMTSSVSKAALGKMEPSPKTLASIDECDRKKIIDEMQAAVLYTGINFESLLEAFLKDFRHRTNTYFIAELAAQLRNASDSYNYSNIEDLISCFRRLVMPYIINCKETLLWVGNLFQQSQVLLLEKVADMRGHADVQTKYLSQILQEISQTLITNFSMQNLMNSLEASLPKLNIPSCYMVLFDSMTNSAKTDKNIFSQCSLVFEYSEKGCIKSEAGDVLEAKQILSDILSSKKGTYTMFTHLLHVSDELMGFILFEPGPIDERVYQALSIHISTAIMGAVLVERLEKSYEKFIEQAYREGMADIVTAILHNIGNVFNSVNSSVQILKDVVRMSPVEDLVKANMLLEKNLDSLESFLCNDVKGKKLMHFYLMLEKSFIEYRDLLFYHIDRIDNKIAWINDIITAQQSYAGVSSTLEELDLINVIEDVLKVNLASLEKYSIEVVRNYRNTPKALVQRVKLFHILINLIHNAREAMLDTPQQRRLVITLDCDNSGKYIRITDGGQGIPAELLEKVFDYEYSNKKEGQGFGLYSCANYMSEMGGKIWAESEGEGKGATYVLYFP